MVSENDIRNSRIFDFQVFPIQDDILASANGNNEKNVLVCLAEELTPELSTFLSKILNSVGINPEADTITLSVLNQHPFSFAKLDNEKVIKHAIFFGVPPKMAGLNFDAKPYQLFRFKDKSFLFVNPLSEIQSKPEFKRPLWEGLKEMMGV